MSAAQDRASRSFAAEPISVREARRFLRGFLAERGRNELTGAAELALSEVATNAVLHARTGFDVTAHLADDGSLHVEVADGSSQLPAARGYGVQATTGRGMQLVAAATAECGVRTSGPSGKVVWFVVRGDGQGADPTSGSWRSESDRKAVLRPGAEVVLLGLPPALWLAARQHHDAVLRELVLYAQQHPGDAPSAERFADADLARGLVSAEVVAAVERRADGLAAAHAASSPGAASLLRGTVPPLDLHVRVPAGAGTSYGALQDVLDAAERLAVAGLLLARPALPEIVAVRDWVCEQVIAQLAGVPPSPWPGTGQERFTVEVRDRADAADLEWDPSPITEATRGAVAADDANRIIAVSRPLAEALGWAVHELVGRRVVALVPPELREAHVAGFTRHLTTGQTQILGVPLRLPVLRADGSRLECHALIERLDAVAGRPVYVAWLEPVVRSAPGG